MLVIQSEQEDEVVDVLTVDQYNTDDDDDDDVMVCPLKSHNQATYNDEATTNGIISYSSNNFLLSVRNRLLTKGCRRFSLIVEKLPLQVISQATNCDFFVNKLPPSSKNDSDKAYSKPLLKDTSHGVIPSKSSPAVMVEKDSNESISQRIISRRSRRKPLTMPTKSRSVSTISTRSSVKQPVPQIESTQETLLKSHNNSQGTSNTTVKGKKSGKMFVDDQIQSSTSNNTTHKSPVAAIAEEDPLVQTLSRQQTSSRNNKRRRVQSPNKRKPTKKTTSKNKKQPKSSSANQLTSTKPSELITSTLSTSHSPPSLSDSFMFSTESSLSTMTTENHTHSNGVTPSTNDTTSASIISEASSVFPQKRRRSLRRKKLPLMYNNDEYNVSLPSTLKTRQQVKKSNYQLKVNSLTECSKLPQRNQQNKKPTTRPSHMAKTLKSKKGIKHSESSLPTSTTQKTRNSSKQNNSKSISNKLASNKTTTSTSEPCVTTRSKRKKLLDDTETKVQQQLKQHSLDVKPSRQKRGRKSNISSSEPSLIKTLNSSKQPEVKKTLTQPTKPKRRQVNDDDELHSVPIFSKNHDLSDSSVNSGFSLLDFSDFTIASGEFDDDFQSLDSKTSHSNRNQEIAKLSETTKPSPFNRGSKRNQPLPVPSVSESFPSTDGQSHKQTRRGKRRSPTSKPPSTKRAKRTVTSEVSTKLQQASVDLPSTNTISKAQSQLTNTTKCSQATQTSPFISDTHTTQQPVSTSASNIHVNLPVKRTQNKKRIVQTSSLVKKSQTNELTSVPSSLINEVINECSSSSSSSSSDSSYSAPISARLSSRSTVPSSQSTRNFKSIKKSSPATKSTTQKLQKGTLIGILAVVLVT